MALGIAITDGAGHIVEWFGAASDVTAPKRWKKTTSASNKSRYHHCGRRPVWRVQPGAVWRYQTNAGGGWGDPLEREPALAQPRRLRIQQSVQFVAQIDVFPHEQQPQIRSRLERVGA